MGLQAHFGSSARKAVGIELLEDRHCIAEAALARILPYLLGGTTHREVQFECGDLMKMDITDATTIYFSSLLFGESLMLAASRMFDCLPGVRWVASLQMLP